MPDDEQERGAGGTAGTQVFPVGIQPVHPHSAQGLLGLLAVHVNDGAVVH